MPDWGLWVFLALVVGGFGVCGACGACGACIHATSPSGHIVNAAPTEAAASASVVSKPDEAAPILKLCGAPSSDKTTANNRKGWDETGGTRSLVFKKANVELMYFVPGADAGSEAIVGIFPANTDPMADQLTAAEANRRLPCAKGLIHKP